MFFKVVRYGETWLSNYHAKVKAKELILKDIFDYTAEDLKFWEEYRWFDTPNTLKGEYYPFMGNKLSGLTRFIDILISKYKLNSFKNIAFQHNIVISGSKKYLYIVPVNAHQRDQVYSLDFTPLKFAIEIKENKIIYKLESYIYDDNDRKNALALNDFWTDEDRIFADNYKWWDCLNSLSGDIVPFPSSRLRSLYSLLNNLFQQKKIFKDFTGRFEDLTKGQLNQIRSLMQLEGNYIDGNNYLWVRLFDESGKEIKDYSLPLKYLLVPDFTGTETIIRYELAEDSFTRARNKMTEIFKKGYENINDDDLDFLDLCDYEIEVNSKDGIVYLLKDAPCYLLNYWLKQSLQSGAIDSIEGTKLKVQGRIDEDAMKMVLDIFLIKINDSSFNNAIKPYSVYVTYESGKFVYAKTPETDPDYWSFLQEVFKKEAIDISAQEEKFANSYKPWRRKVFSDGYTGYVTIFNNRVEKIFSSITRGLRERGLINDNLVGCRVEFQPMIDRRSSRKQLWATVIDKEGHKFDYEYNLIKLDVKYDDKKGLHVVPAADNYNSAREKALKLFWKDNAQLSAEELGYINNYSFMENYRYEILVFEKLRLRVSKQIIKYFEGKGFAPKDLRLQFSPKVSLENNRKFINVDFLDPKGQRILSPELPSLKYEVPAEGVTLSPAADAFFPIRDFYASLAALPFDQISETVAQVVNNFSGFTEEFNPNYFAPLAGVVFKPMTGLLKKFVEEGYLDMAEGIKLSYKLVLELESRKKSIFITVLDKQRQKINVFYNPIILNVENGPAGKDIIYEIGSYYTQDEKKYVNNLLWWTDLSLEQVQFLSRQTWIQKLSMKEKHFTIGSNLVLPNFQAKLIKDFDLPADKDYYVQINPGDDYNENDGELISKTFLIDIFQSKRLQKRVKRLKVIKDTKTYNYKIEEEIILVA